MNQTKLINWLLEGDIAIQYQTHRDLLDTDDQQLQTLRARINQEGWTKQFLEKQNPDGHWGKSFYNPKWISTHYTLLDLRNLEATPNPAIMRILDILLQENIEHDGGINPKTQHKPVTIRNSDVCINGMFLDYACHFGVDGSKLHTIVDFIITNHMPDGGFNCQLNRSGATHSSLHTTISTLEGIHNYLVHGYDYRADELKNIQSQAIEFMLMHKLYKSDKTGEMIQKAFTMLSYPSRWKYDILRALDYLQKTNHPFDERLEDALAILKSKKRKDDTWPVQAKHAGQVHFDMEQTGKSSHWNTLRALRVLNHFYS